MQAQCSRETGLEISAPPKAGTVGETRETLLEFPDNRLLIDLCGEYDRNLALVEQKFEVQILRRGNSLVVVGEAGSGELVAMVLRQLYGRLEAGHAVDAGEIEGLVRLGLRAAETGTRTSGQLEMFGNERVEIRTRKKPVVPREGTQTAYVKNVFEHELAFSIGPAGTGKTYLAVAVGVSMFIGGQVDRIVLSRPAVEAGEHLGFLPGDMKEKVDPYMQPLYDALHDFLPARQVARLIEEKKIEIAPLAFMRGRTLSNSFVVLDEAQNATEMQMKMFLTRLGKGSRMVITGDLSQVDLPHGQRSGLADAERRLYGIREISFDRFTSKDVVRHPLVAKIVDAYERKDAGT